MKAATVATVAAPFATEMVMSGEIQIEFGATSRGFKIARFVDQYRQECSLQESSMSGPPTCVWLGVAGELARMHLSQEHVRALLPALQHFADTGELP